MMDLFLIIDFIVNNWNLIVNIYNQFIDLIFNKNYSVLVEWFILFVDLMGDTNNHAILKSIMQFTDHLFNIQTVKYMTVLEHYYKHNYTDFHFIINILHVSFKMIYKLDGNNILTYLIQYFNLIVNYIHNKIKKKKKIKYVVFFSIIHLFIYTFIFFSIFYIFSFEKYSCRKRAFGFFRI